MRTLLISLVIAVISVAAYGAENRAEVSAALNVSALQPGKSTVVAVILNIKPGFHAQSRTPIDEFAVKLEVIPDVNPLLTFKPPVYPPGKNEEYPALGKLNVYTGRTIIYLPIEVHGDTRPGPIRISGKMTYQLCNDKECFFPQKDVFAIETSIVDAGKVVAPQHAELFQGLAAPQVQTDLKELAGWVLFAFVVGIIFNLMPCVLPVVPLKAIGFYEVSQHNRRKSMALGAVFSLGLVASFAVLAVLVIVLQWLKWGEMFANPWFRGAIIVVLLVMAISTLGAFAVNLPTSIYRFTPRHDTYTGNFLFGILTAVLSTPCTFGMFIGLLAWAATQPSTIGVLLVMMVGAGMAFPYFLLSAVPELARRFPRTGPWAEIIKQLMGFLLLGTAVFFAKPFIEKALNSDAVWWGLFAVIAMAAIFLVLRSLRFSKRIMPRAIAIVVALAMLIPAFLAVRRLTFHPHDWKNFSDQRLADARSEGKITLVEFTADWCGNCQYVEAFRLNNPQVVSRIKSLGVVMLKADVTDNDAPSRVLLNKLNGVGGIPLTAIYSPSQPQPILLNGIYSLEELQKAIDQAAEVDSTTPNKEITVSPRST